MKKVLPQDVKLCPTWKVNVKVVSGALLYDIVAELLSSWHRNLAH